MNGKPIIFSSEMVRALLEGRKTQTRRVMKDQPAPYKGGVHPNHVAKHPAPYIDAYCSERKTASNPRGMSNEWCWWTEDDRCGPFVGECPYKPGDLLWVRETWGINHTDYCTGIIPKERPEDVHDDQMVYFFTEDDPEIQAEMPKRPSIHMPRWASRLTLRITNIRAERLQDISRGDAILEGASMRPACNGCMSRYDGWSMDWAKVGAPSKFGVNGVLTEQCISLGDPQAAFLSYWTDLYGEHETKSVGANPWVWVYDFEVIRENIDRVISTNPRQ